MGQAVHGCDSIVLRMSQIGSMVGRAQVSTGKHRTGVGPGWLWIGPDPGI